LLICNGGAKRSDSFVLEYRARSARSEDFDGAGERSAQVTLRSIRDSGASPLMTKIADPECRANANLNHHPKSLGPGDITQ